MTLVINNKNLINWLELCIDVVELNPWVKRKIRRYINRTDTIRRQKEIDSIFGGEEWLI